MDKEFLERSLDKYPNITGIKRSIPMILGKKIELKIPNGEIRNGQFAVVELKDLKASHHEYNFNSTVDYPLDSKGQNINDRNYETDLTAQQKVNEFSQGLEPDRLISTSRTPSGTPIIIANGVVVSGNNRTMSLKRAVKDHPEKYDEYLIFLSEEIAAFGFTATQEKQVFDLTHPVLVRLDYDIPALNTLELSKYNKETKKSERPVDKAIKLGKMLQENQKCKDAIGEIVGQYETFSEFYSDRNSQKKLLDTLISCNILTDLERPLYFSDNGFTTNGKDLIENILVGVVLSQEALLDVNENVRKYRGMLITTLPVLSLNSTLMEYSIMDELNQALILEAKIVNSKLDFKDWLFQKNMFDERPSKNILYFNRFLTIGRNKFKQNLEKYNFSAKESTGENMLFGEPATKEEIFTKFIVEQITEDDYRLINLSSEMSTEDNPVVELVTSKEINLTSNVNLFANGNYFKQYPDNVLAEQKPGTSRYKKPITLYKGSIENISRIQVDYDILPMITADNPTLSNINTPITELSGVDTAQVFDVEEAIKQSKKDIEKKKKRKLKSDNASGIATSANDKLETFSIKEVFNEYNPDVSIEELKVFLWYQKTIGKPVNNIEWYEIAGLKDHWELNFSNPETNETILNWAKDGLVFYDKRAGGFVPSYIYLSGNVYDKYNRIAKSDLSENVGADAKYIIDNFGKSVYDNQLLEMERVFKSKYESRLIISSNDSNAVTILPNSNFAKTFFIKTLADEAPFKWKTITAGSNKRFGQIDFLAQVYSERDKKVIPELSLSDAFALWLVTDKAISVKQGITYADIINYYIYFKSKPRTEAPREDDGTYSSHSKSIIAKENAAFERLKSKSKKEGDRLFNIFLDTQLLMNDRILVEIEWNRQFNNNVQLNYNKIPVGFRMNKFVAGQPLDLRPEKREAVAFTVSNGSGLLAYDVGVGKTPSAIFTVSAFIDLGWADRPVFVVPNQTYKQWINEFKNFAAHIPLNKFYNLNDSIIEEFQDTNGNTMAVPEGSVTIMTYEGMLKLGFNTAVQQEMEGSLIEILSQDTSKMTDKEAEAAALKENTAVQALIGKALSKTKVNFDDFGFDYICMDEAHACKKVFTSVSGEPEENTGNSGKRTKPISKYKIQSGTPSVTAIKGFILCQYIQNNFGGNTQLLTATPFTNSPLEIFSMLAMIGYGRLKAINLNNLNVFFDTFVDVSDELVINTALNPERKQVILGFNNLIVIQQLVQQFINHKTGESVNIQRPNKIVLPMTRKLIDGVTVELDESEQVTASLPMSKDQARYMREVKLYAEGKLTQSELESASRESDQEEEVDEDGITSEGVELDADSLDDDEKVGVRLLRALSFSRNIALSPYLYKFHTLGKPTAKEYIATSGKLSYVMQCIASIKAHHQKTKTPMSGVVIYIERGVHYFNLIREYLIKELGFDDHEVGIISAKQRIPLEKGITADESKEYVKNLFLGKTFNKATLEEEPIPDEQRLKVLIGSSTIREGINLQEYSSTLFNCFLTFNPTDVQQLEGRIYRQKNAFKNVRIVNPLMIDSSDIFMFQKLEEKTSRINSIFQTDGVTNVLKTEEFNPKELKYSLVSDPNVLAKMEVVEETETISEDISDLRNEIKKLESVSDYERTLKNWTAELDKEVLKYRPSSVSKTLEEKIRSIQHLIRTGLDEKGHVILERWQTDEDLPKGKIRSSLPRFYKPYWFDDYVLSFRNLKRIEKDFLTPKGYNTSQIEPIISDINAEIEKKSLLIKQLDSEEALSIRARQIILRREELNIVPKTIKQVVNEFESLNYLLDDVKVRQAKRIIALSCPPVDDSGKVRIDGEGLRLLQDCIDAFPNTKFSNGTTFKNEDGTESFKYSPERLKLHKEIIKDMTSDAVCVEQETPIAVIMGGAPGSGKSTYLRNNAPYMESNLIWKVDADEARSRLPEYKGWNSPATHEEAQDLVKELLDNYDTPCKHDLLYDGTMSNAKKYYPIIKRLKKMGYKIFLVFMDIEKSISIERALNRYRDNNGSNTEFGRYVPIHVIDSFYQTGDDGFQQLKSQVDGYIKVDSLSQEIVEEGGMTIPEDRPYFEITKKKRKSPVKKSEKSKASKKEDVSESKSIKEAIDSLIITLDFVTISESKSIKEAIEALEISMQFL